MNQEQISKIILHTLGEVVPNADLQSLEPDISFHDQLEIDSIDFIRFVTTLERALKITIVELDYPELSTPRGCENYLMKKFNLSDERGFEATTQKDLAAA
jgi:acyl carrier protein